MNRGLTKFKIDKLNLYYGTTFAQPVFDLAQRSSSFFSQICEALKDSQKLGIDDFSILRSDSVAGTKLEVNTYNGQSYIEVTPSSLMIYAMDMIQDEDDMKVCMDYITACEHVSRNSFDASLLERKIVANIWIKLEHNASKFKNLFQEHGARVFPFINELPLHSFFWRGYFPNKKRFQS